MLRLAGVLPNLFLCGVCSRTLDINEERFLAPGLFSVICEACDHRNASGMLNEVVELAHTVLKHPLNGDVTGTDKAVRTLHELNEYWIRHYSER